MPREEEKVKKLVFLPLLTKGYMGQHEVEKMIAWGNDGALVASGPWYDKHELIRQIIT